MLLGKFLDFRTFTETLTISHFALAISRCDVHRDRRCRRRPLDHHRRFRLVLAASKAKSRHDGRVSNNNDDKRQTQKGSRKSGSRTHMKSKCLFSLTYATIMMDVKVSCARPDQGCARPWALERREASIFMFFCTYFFQRNKFLSLGFPKR